jgi:hypothetical protein
MEGLQMSKMHGGKGDIPRPLAVPREKFDANFEAIFGRKTKMPQPEMKEVRREQRDTKREMGNEND